MKQFDPWECVVVTAEYRSALNALSAPMDHYSYTVSNYNTCELKQKIGDGFYCTIGPARNTRTPTKISAAFMINPIYTHPDDIYRLVHSSIELSITINQVTYTKTFQLNYRRAQ